MSEEEIKPLLQVQQEHVKHVLSLYNGDVKLAAKALRVGRSTLYRWLVDWGMKEGRKARDGT